MVVEAEEASRRLFGRGDVFNRAGWDYVVEHLGGKLPVSAEGPGVCVCVIKPPDQTAVTLHSCSFPCLSTYCTYYVQLQIRAVPEGSLVPVGNALFTVESTDERVPWVATYFEDILSQVVSMKKKKMK